MGEKKRKRGAVETGGTSPKENISTSTNSPDIKVLVSAGEDIWRPAFVSSPGVTLPSAATFQPYVRDDTNEARIHLHSDIHPKLDYIADETRFNETKNHLKDYLAIYDPVQQILQLRPAKRLNVRSRLKSARARSSSDSQKALNRLAARNALGLAFGTKKSIKAIQSITANAISPAKSAAVPGSTPGSQTIQFDPISSALLSSMRDSGTTASQEELNAEIAANKPRPKANLTATAPQDVYDVNTLVGGEGMLNQMRTQAWQAALGKQKEGKEVLSSPSKFVALRMQAIIEAEDNIRMTRLLRYLEMLIWWYNKLSTSSPKQGRKVHPTTHKELAPLLTAYGTEPLTSLATRFAQGNLVNKWHTDNVISHIFAITLIIDNFETSTKDIQEDLKIDAKSCGKYYQELGCYVEKLSKVQLQRLGLSQTEGTNTRRVKLRLPLVFPKERVPLRAKKRGR